MDLVFLYNSANPVMAMEVKVSAVSDQHLIFQTKTGETITIPKTILLSAASPKAAGVEKQFQPGDQLIFEFKKQTAPLPSLESTIQKAHEEKSHRDEEKMRRLLEELIN